MTSRLLSLREGKEPTSSLTEKDVWEYAVATPRFYVSYVSSKCLDMLVLAQVTNLISSLKLSFSSPGCSNLE